MWICSSAGVLVPIESSGNASQKAHGYIRKYRAAWRHSICCLCLFIWTKARVYMCDAVCAAGFMWSAYPVPHPPLSCPPPSLFSPKTVFYVELPWAPAVSDCMCARVLVYLWRANFYEWTDVMDVIKLEKHIQEMCIAILVYVKMRIYEYIHYTYVYVNANVCSFPLRSHDLEITRSSECFIYRNTVCASST